MKVLTSLSLCYEPDNSGSALDAVKIYYRVTDGAYTKNGEQTITIDYMGIESSVELYNSIVDLIKAQEGIV